MEFKDFSRTSPKIQGLFKTVRTRVIYKFINMSLQHIVLLEASTRSPQSHTCLNGLFLFHFWLFSVSVPFCFFLSQLSELVWKLAGEKSLQLAALGSFPFPGPPANGNESNAKKSRFCSNRTLTGTIYY